MFGNVSKKWFKMVAVAIALGLILTLSMVSRAEGDSESKTFKVLTYNIAGLPKALSGADIGYRNTPAMGQLMNDYDLVGVQEDFSYHDVLLEVTKFPYYSNWSGDVPLGDILDLDLKNLFTNHDVGDGLNLFSNFPMTKTTRIEWNKHYGLFKYGADASIPKGFSFNRVEFAPNVFVDVYNLHGDAGFDDGSCEARGDNLKQLGEYIQQKSVGNAVIVMGDTNAYHFRNSDNIRGNVLEPNGLKDPWIELVRNGIYPEQVDNWQDVKMWEKDTAEGVDRNGPDYETVDKIFYRSGNGVRLQAVDYKAEEDKFKDSQGERLSDHYAWCVTFEYELMNEMPNKVYLSHLPVESGYSGYGPVETDKSNGEKSGFDGNTMRLNEATFSRGLGVHAHSELIYNLEGRYEQFQSYVGIDDESGGGSLSFEVWGDDRKLFDSGMMNKYSDTQFVNVDIAGVQKLKLKALDGGNGIKCDHANWAEAVIIKNAEGLDAAPFMINNDHQDITYNNLHYYGGRNLGDYKGDVHQSTQNGAYVEYTFYGTGIDYIGVKNQDIGNQKVILDGETITINAYASFYSPQMILFSKHDLPLGFHTIKIIKESGNWMVVDGFKVYNPSNTSPVFLSDLAWETATNGYGPVEVDRANGGTGTADGPIMKLNGVTYNRGLGVHANSEIVYNLNKKYSRFISDIGVDDAPNGGSIKFEVWGDGSKLYDSGSMIKTTPTQTINIDISEVDRLILKVIDYNGNNRCDHGNWANARVE